MRLEKSVLLTGRLFHILLTGLLKRHALISYSPSRKLRKSGRCAGVQVADEYIGLDVLSSQMDVKTSNFRRVPALQIYGCAQPSRQVPMRQMQQYVVQSWNAVKDCD